MPFKQVYYDSQSLNPSQGDTVVALVHHYDQPMEELRAVYMGAVQIESYTTPYFRFLCDGGKVRLVNANAVREIRYTITGPQMESLPELEAPEEGLEF